MTTVQTLSIPATTHGRVLLRLPQAPPRQQLTQQLRSGLNSTNCVPISITTLVGFHGYGQSADNMLDELQRLPGTETCTLVAVQALHRFYARSDERVIASWMTRQDRDEAIADNIAYVARALHEVTGPRTGNSGSEDTAPDRPQAAAVPPISANGLAAIGFSQGVAMAYRAALCAGATVSAIVAVGGDIPPDVKTVPAPMWPRVIVAAGNEDHWYTAEKLSADERFLVAHGVPHTIIRYSGKHEFTSELRATLSRELGLSNS